MRKQLVAMVFAVVALMMLSPFFGFWTNSGGNLSANTATGAGASVAGGPVAAAAWTPGTTTMQEPGYTNGTYKVATVNNIGHENIYLSTSLYAQLLSGEIYGAAVNVMPNGSYSPWLATNWHETNYTGASGNHTTFDPLTGTWQTYNFGYTVHIRPGVQWTDWTAANASQTYTFSNSITANNGTGPEYSHTYNYSSMTMNTYTVQSADFILSWEIMQSALDYSGSYSNVVNVVPINNLTVEYLLSSQSATFTTYTLETPVLPYHLWRAHAFANIQGDWNYSASGASGMGYDTWELGYNPSTGYAPALIGTGPFMMTGYGMPHGYSKNGFGWQLYVNPHFWVQYANVTSGLRQYTPKIYSLEYIYYSTLSNAVTAMSGGEVQTITEGVTPSFVPVVNSMANTYIYHKPSSGYGFMQFNSSSSNAPFNITAFRQALNYATNKQYLASVVDSGYDILGTPLIPPSDPLWRNASTPSYTYSPSKAQALLSGIPGMQNNTNGAGTGWTYNGKKVTADIQITSAGPNPLGVEGALLIAQWWSAMGISTTVTQEAFTTLVPNLIQYNFNTISLGITGISGDPTGDYFAFYNSVAGAGTGFYLGPFTSMTYGGHFYTGPQVNSLMNNLTVKLNSITNLAKRIQISDELQGIAAIQSTMINLGYGVDILPFTTTDFVNISTVNALPYAGYMYWAPLTVHMKTGSGTPPPTYPSQLEVSVQTNALTYYNGQNGTVTVTVYSNLTGAPVSGASVTIAATPAGAIINTTSMTGVTNANGKYVLDFYVLGTQPLIYTQGYSGPINFTASASSSQANVKSGIGYAVANMLPNGIKIVTSPMPTLVAGGASHSYWIKVEDSSGSPISGFAYTIQTMNGAVNMAAAGAGETLTATSTANVFFGAYYSVNNTNSFNDLNVTSISGVTGANGTIYVSLSANASYNFAAAGTPASSYIFFGSIAQGTPVVGKSGYMIPAEMTSAQNLNGNGFGLQQPIELPVELASASPTIKVNLTVSKDTMAYNGSITVTVTAYNTTTGKTVSGYVVNLLAQNDLGANRGFFDGSGSQILGSNPNSVFGSVILPGMQVVTGKSGSASVTFMPNYYSYNYNLWAQYGYPEITEMPYQMYTAVVPFDMFTLMATGANSAAASPTNTTVVYSTAQQLPTQMFSVTFSAMGLPSGTSWTLHLSNGQSYSVSGASKTVSLAAGVYSYSIVSSNSAYTTHGGVVSVESATTAPIQFKSVDYSVTVTETGLPSGSSWYVIAGGQEYTSTGSSISFMAMNGTVSYTVGTTVSGYNLTKATGSVTVSGASASASVTFNKITTTVKTVTNTTSTSSGMSVLEYGLIGAVVVLLVIVGALAVMMSRRPKQ